MSEQWDVYCGYFGDVTMGQHCSIKLVEVPLPLLVMIHYGKDKCIGIPITKIGQLWDHLIFIMGIPTCSYIHNQEPFTVLTSSWTRITMVSWLSLRDSPGMKGRESWRWLDCSSASTKASASSFSTSSLQWQDSSFDWPTTSNIHRDQLTETYTKHQYRATQMPTQNISHFKIYFSIVFHDSKPLIHSCIQISLKKHTWLNQWWLMSTSPYGNHSSPFSAQSTE